MNEDLLIRLLTQGAPRRKGAMHLGVGDDCSIIRCGGKEILVSTDQLVEGIHFRKDLAPWEVWGAKAAATALSDIAAMGGRPRYAWVALGIPRGMSPKAIRNFYTGLRRTLRRYKTWLAGGNITGSPKGLSATTTVWGETAPGRAMRRDKARAGDSVFVSGVLGKSIAKHWARIPEPRIALGRRLLATGCRCCIDVSDGLLQDAKRVALASKVRIVLDARKIPVAGKSFRRAVTAGEDYELLFTLPEKKSGPWREIGRVRKGKPGLTVLNTKGKPMRFQRLGFQHRVG